MNMIRNMQTAGRHFKDMMMGESVKKVEAALDDARAVQLGRARVRRRQPRRVERAVGRRVHGAVHVRHLEQRVDALRLGGREHVRLDAVLDARLRQALILAETLLVARNEEAAVLGPRRARLLLELNRQLARSRVQPFREYDGVFC